MPIGERMRSTGYIKHPPASSGWWPDGAPLDAGTAHIIHTDLSHLSEQNTRLIGHARGPGALLYADGRGAWPTIIDADQADDEIGAIPWNQPGSAVVFGPVALSMTRLGTAPAGFTPRKIRVVVEVEKGSTATTQLRVFAVLTGGPDTPLRAPRYAVDWDTLTDATPGSGQYVIDLDLTVTAPVRPTTSWRGRAAGDGASTDASSPVTPAWVWVGWDSFNASNTDRVWSVSAFEVF